MTSKWVLVLLNRYGRAFSTLSQLHYLFFSSFFAVYAIRLYFQFDFNWTFFSCSNLIFEVWYGSGSLMQRKKKLSMVKRHFELVSKLNTKVTWILIENCVHSIEMITYLRRASSLVMVEGRSIFFCLCCWNDDGKKWQSTKKKKIDPK